MNHHYLPVFYLRQWAAKDGRLVEFTRFRGKLKPIRRSPTGAGCKKDLYRIAGIDLPLAQVFETGFLSKIDDAAARALQKFKCGESQLTDVEKAGWVQFILSIMARSPESVDTLKAVFEDKMVDARSELGSIISCKSAEIDSIEACKAALSLIKTHILDENILNLLRSMPWFTVSIKTLNYSFLTSDRPVLISNGLDKPNGQIIIPVSPNDAFIATRTQQLANQIKGIHLLDLANQINKWVVEQAYSHVYASSETMTPFIERHISKRRIDLYVDYRKHAANLRK